MVKLSGFETAPLGFCTVTMIVEISELPVRSEAGIAALSWELLMNVVGRLLPFQRRTAPSRKSEPLTVRLNVGLLATFVFGLRLEITGGGGITVTRNDRYEALPNASVAVQFTVVVPIGNAEPEGGLQMTT